MRVSSTSVASLALFSAVFAGCLPPRAHSRGATVAHVEDMAPSASIASRDLVLDVPATDDATDVDIPATGPKPGSDPTPALTYARMSGDMCEAELKKRSVPYLAVSGPVRGVDRPVRLTGPIRGIDIHSGEAKSKRASSIYEIVDCRLVLALDDFAKVLVPLDVVEVIHMSMYRPPPKGSDLTKPRSQHEAGMAMDLGIIVQRDGTQLSVVKEWHGRIGLKSCGPLTGPLIGTKNARLLRKVYCDTAELKIFNLQLSPNHDAKHFNHFHLEVKRGVSWFIVK